MFLDLMLIHHSENQFVFVVVGFRGTNCVHGVQSYCGTRCPTSFPSPNALGAAFNMSLWQDMAGRVDCDCLVAVVGGW